MTVYRRGSRWYYDFVWEGVRYTNACGKLCKTKTQAKRIEERARVWASRGRRLPINHPPCAQCGGDSCQCEPLSAPKSTIGAMRRRFESLVAGLSDGTPATWYVECSVGEQKSKVLEMPSIPNPKRRWGKPFLPRRCAAIAFGVSRSKRDSRPGASAMARTARSFGFHTRHT